MRRGACSPVTVVLWVLTAACGPSPTALLDDTSSACDTPTCAEDSDAVPARARRAPSPRPPPPEITDGGAGSTSSGADPTPAPATTPAAANAPTPAPPQAPPIDCASDEDDSVPTAVARCTGADAGAAEPVPAGEEPALSVLTIRRARWDRDNQVLELRGEVSSSTVTLRAEFFDRSEAVANNDGSFRAEFSDVTANPTTVRVAASDGSTASVSVEEN